MLHYESPFDSIGLIDHVYLENKFFMGPITFDRL